MTPKGNLSVTCSLALVASLTATAQANAATEAVATDVATQPAGASANDQAVPQSGPSRESTPPDRSYSDYRFNSTIGSTGTIHVVSADSGAPGTFRLAYLTSYYAGDGFLCPTRAHCNAPPRGVMDAQDVGKRTASALTLTMTPLPYLELGLGLHSHAYSNNFNSPSVIQALADTYAGMKFFTPRHPDQVFSIGWLGQLRLLNSAGSIGIDTANVLLSGLATADFSNRSNPKQRVPVRLHANIGYLFDNSSAIVSDVEKRRQHPVSRIERFGFGINRVDSVVMGIGAEYVGKYLQPFTEWSLDIASNRQGYVCQARTLSRGDTCLEYKTGMSTTPSRWTVGTHLRPHWYGLTATLALDVATSGSVTFVEERSPEIPWNLYVGIGYSADPVRVSSPRPQPAAPRVVQLAPPPEHHLVGLVSEEDSNKPIAHAQIEFEGGDHTGLISKNDGTFDSGPLEPGEYKLNVKADGYKEGTCSAAIAAEPKGPGLPQPSEKVKNTEIKCALRPAPALGVVEGIIIDAETGVPVARAAIRVRDERNRILELQSDDKGVFRVENVPAGEVHLAFSADGYLPSDTLLDVKKQVEQHASLVARKIPKKPGVTISPKEVKLSKQILFTGSSAEIAPESKPVVQEIAAVLQQHPELTSIEIQGHTDDAGSPAFSKRLSLERAESVRAALAALGVDASRLSATGLGSDKPLAPNTTDTNRAKNRRVQLIILNRAPTP